VFVLILKIEPPLFVPSIDVCPPALPLIWAAIMVFANELEIKGSKVRELAAKTEDDVKTNPNTIIFNLIIK
jgi:hypothetical protein